MTGPLPDDAITAAETMRRVVILGGPEFALRLVRADLSAFEDLAKAALPGLTGTITSQAEDEEPVYEAGHSQVDWERLNRLRAAGAVESDDLADWYAEQNMLEPRVQHAAIAAQAAADERERIRQLAVDVDAWFMDAQPQPPSFGVVEVERPFADLLGGTADGAHTPGGEIEAFTDGYTAGHAAGQAQALVHEPVSACGVARCGIIGPHQHTIYGPASPGTPGGAT